MTGTVRGKVAVISGGSTGVGQAVAGRLAADGAKVVLLARRPDRLRTAAARMPGSVVAIPTDISDGEAVQAAFGHISAQFGRVDILMNCAGTARIRAVADMSDDDIQACIGTNLVGPIHTMRAAVPLMRAAKGGHIINLSSEITLDHMPLMSLYAAGKHGLNGFTKAMHRELRPDGIRVSLVILGSVADSTFSENFTDEERQHAQPAWLADAYLTRVGAYRPVATATIAEVLHQMLLCPPDAVQDVVHIRPAG